MKKNIKNKIIYIVFSIFLIASLVFLIMYFSSKNIKLVRTVLKPEYSNIKCLDDFCTSIVAIKEDKKGNIVYSLLNDKAKKVAKYIVKKSDKKIKEPIYIRNNYFIVKEKIDDKKNEYSINNKFGKELYSTKNTLISINQKYILEKGEQYTLIEAKGDKVLSDISEYNLYNKNKIIEIVTNNEYIIYDELKGRILNNYKIDKEVKDENDNTLYLVVKNIKTGVYQYYNVHNYKIIGDSFENYNVTINNELKVTKRENGTIENYKVSTNGKQNKIKNKFSKVSEVNKMQKKIDQNNYYLYSTSIYKNNQNIVLVDNKKTYEFGFYNIKSKKFSKIYSYKKSDNVYSSVSKLNSDNENNYLEVSCSKNVCDTNKLYVININDKKIEYSNENEKLILQNYIQYKNGYKVIKYSNKTEDEKYKGKYVLYDETSKELLNSEFEIIVLNEKVVFGPVKNESVLLYSIKNNKAINNKPANLIKLKNKEYYKYQDENNNTILLDFKGNEMIKVSMGQNLKNSNDALIYIDNTMVKMYKDNFKYSVYKLEKNEKLVDENSYDLLPYKGAIFINNKKDNYFKIVNFNGLKIRKIKNSNISSIYQNNDKNVYIISKKKENKKILYGLYLAK